jgi:hypothetical protein
MKRFLIQNHAQAAERLTELTDLTRSLLDEHWGPGFKGSGIPVTLEFCDLVAVRRNDAKQVVGQRFEVKLFLGPEDTPAYTFYRASGYPLASLPYEKLVAIECWSPDDVLERQTQDWKKLSSRFHPHVWRELKNRIETDPQSLAHERGKPRIAKMTTRFGADIVAQLAEAFERKTAFHHQRIGAKRTLELETRLGEDGAFRGWFASEDNASGKYDTYELISPTTAIFAYTD